MKFLTQSIFSPFKKTSSFLFFALIGFAKIAYSQGCDLIPGNLLKIFLVHQNSSDALLRVEFAEGNSYADKLMNNDCGFIVNSSNSDIYSLLDCVCRVSYCTFDNYCKIYDGVALYGKNITQESLKCLVDLTDNFCDDLSLSNLKVFGYTLWGFSIFICLLACYKCNPRSIFESINRRRDEIPINTRSNIISIYSPLKEDIELINNTPNSSTPLSFHSR